MRKVENLGGKPEANVLDFDASEMTFEKGSKQNKETLKSLNQDFKNDTGVEMDLESFSKGMWKETNFYKCDSK